MTATAAWLRDSNSVMANGSADCQRRSGGIAAAVSGEASASSVLLPIQQMTSNNQKIVITA